jgi:hypothetical protein
MDYWRRPAGISRLDRKRNERVRKIMRVDGNIVEDIRKKQLILYGHVKRMEEERLPKQLLECNAEGRRCRGKPRTTWKQDIVTAMAERNLQEGGWMDRQRWKTLGSGRH